MWKSSSLFVWTSKQIHMANTSHKNTHKICLKVRIKAEVVMTSLNQ